MSKRILKGTVLISGIMTASYSVYKAIKEFFEYKKLENNDIYINSDMMNRDFTNMKPIIRSSICNGEKEAGFKDSNGKFISVMLINNDKDLENFKKAFQIEGSIPVEY